MTFVYRPPHDPPPPHRCRVPARYTRDDWQTQAIDYGTPPTPAQGEGAIWQCDHCGNYWWFHYLGLGLWTWHPVRWWNLAIRHRIKEEADA